MAVGGNNHSHNAKPKVRHKKAANRGGFLLSTGAKNMKQQLTTTMNPEFRAAIEEQQQAYNAAANKSRVSEAEYKDAILRLLKLAQDDSSASEVAAQILLSTYNSYNWHAPLAWFCHLDALNFDAAITVIKGRWSLHCEPHNAIQNGDALFKDLKKRWPNLPTQG